MATESDTNVTILDHIDDIRVPGNTFQKPVNEYWALICLQHGMEFLYHQALRCDQSVKEQVNPDGTVRFLGGGNFPACDQLPVTLLTCGFHWYAISACQYVKTVGAIARKLDSKRPLPHEYAENIIPEVVAFRDKVAAHFAWTTDNNRDNDAERLASILPPLTFVDDSFHVGTFSVAVRRGDCVSNSQTIRPWSLCKVHESLRQRYWPQLDDSNDDRDAAEQTDEHESE